MHICNEKINEPRKKMLKLTEQSRRVTYNWKTKWRGDLLETSWSLFVQPGRFYRIIKKLPRGELLHNKIIWCTLSSPNFVPSAVLHSCYWEHHDFFFQERGIYAIELFDSTICIPHLRPWKQFPAVRPCYPHVTFNSFHSAISYIPLEDSKFISHYGEKLTPFFAFKTVEMNLSDSLGIILSVSHKNAALDSYFRLLWFCSFQWSRFLFQLTNSVLKFCFWLFL